MLRRLAAIFLLVAMTGLTGCGQDDSYDSKFEISENNRNETRFTIKFGRVPSVTVTELLKQNAPLIRRLKSELNVNITYRFADDYRGIINGMSKNEYDFAWMGPYSYVLSGCYSDTSARYEPLVRPLRRNDEGELSEEYRSLIFTSRESGINSLQELRGKSFAFVDRNSTSGFLFPMAHLIDAGLEPDDDFSYEFLDRHDKVVQQVNEGNYAAGATYEDARMEEFDSLDTANTRLPLLDKTKPIPNSPIVVSSSFAEEHPEVVDRFVSLMTSLHETDEGQAILESLKIARYREASDSDYDDVRGVLDQLSDQLPDVQSFCDNSS